MTPGHWNSLNSFTINLNLRFYLSLIHTGPTAILSLLINRYVRESFDFAIFLTLINGTLIFIFGMLNLGFLVQFISVPVSDQSTDEKKTKWQTTNRWQMTVYNNNQLFIVRFVNRLLSVLRLPPQWLLEVVKWNHCWALKVQQMAFLSHGKVFSRTFKAPVYGIQFLALQLWLYCYFLR